MRHVFTLALTLPLLAGCWAGGPLATDRVAFKHEAVVWVYRAGGQFGRYGILPVAVRNELLELQPGDGCIQVREGQTGGQCSATPQADLQLSQALDLKTGRPVAAHGPARNVDVARPVWRDDKANWETTVDNGAAVFSEGSRLYVRSSAETMVLRLKDPDPAVTYEPELGRPLAAFRMPDGFLVVGLSQGYVVCIDMKKLPGGPREPTRSAKRMPAN